MHDHSLPHQLSQSTGTPLAEAGALRNDTKACTVNLGIVPLRRSRAERLHCFLLFATLHRTSEELGLDGINYANDVFADLGMSTLFDFEVVLPGEDERIWWI